MKEVTTRGYPQVEVTYQGLPVFTRGYRGLPGESSREDDNVCRCNESNNLGMQNRHQAPFTRKGWAGRDYSNADFAE